MITNEDFKLKLISKDKNECKHYKSSLLGEHTLQELIDYVVSRYNHCGEITVFKSCKNEHIVDFNTIFLGCIQYSYGYIKGDVISKDLLSKRINITEVNRQFQHVDYTCYIIEK